METIILVGAEDVRSAASSISASADSMGRTAGYIDESLSRFLTRFEELVVRLENCQGVEADTDG